MTHAKTRLRAIGNSLGVTLPRDVVQHLAIKKGDEIHLVQHPDGILLTAFDPVFANKLDTFDELRRKYRDSLRELAK
jgi:putative addiction module antidote